MKSIVFTFLLLSILSLPGKLMSQEEAKIFDKVYGLDQSLCNGKKYNYIAPLGTKGDQYLISHEFVNGSISIKDKVYQNVSINYDLINQQLLLKYQANAVTFYIIEVSKAWLKGFTLANKNFELLHLGDDPQFYQVLGEKQVRILYYWRKKLDLDVVVGTATFLFSPAVKDSYVLMNGQLKMFRTKRSLINLFDPAIRPEIKSYLHKKKIKLKKATDQDMAELSNYISNIQK